MASDSDEFSVDRKRKRKRISDRRKLCVRDKVEVRSLEEGFLGSWHSGSIVSCSNKLRSVKYNDLLCDDGSDNLIENVEVSSVIDGVENATTSEHVHRGRIRPLPPRIDLRKFNLHYGLCVDALHGDAWWEGVIFDRRDGLEERAIFFPDLGDEMVCGIENLRITQEWNEATEEWKTRRKWLFIELIEELEKEFPLMVSVKQIWYDVRGQMGMEILKEWTSYSKSKWKSAMLKTIKEYLELTLQEIFLRLDLPKESHDYTLGFVLKPGEDLVNSPDDDDDDDEVDPDSKRSYDGRWKVAGPDMVPGAKCCPNAISEFTHPSETNKTSKKLLLNVKKHLLYLGWTIWFKPQKPQHRPIVRFRYLSPSGESYYSLRKAALSLTTEGQIDDSPHQNYPRRLLASHDDEFSPRRSSFTSPDDLLSPPLSEDQQLSEYEPRNTEVMLEEPELCPQAVVEWVEFGARPDWRQNSRNERSRNIKSRARKHLLAMGWEFYYVNKGIRRELRYKSPEGRKYISLITACKGHLEEEGGESNLLQSCVKNESGPISKKKPKRQKEGNKSFVKRKKKKLSGGCPAPRMLRSSKRAREVVAHSSSQQNPRTVLSWLIDNNVVLPRAKVHYRGKDSSSHMAEGRISRDGIKCNCCQNVFTLSGFEAHAGSNRHRPSANIFLEDGRSLLTCQFEMVNGTNLKNFTSKQRNVMEGALHRNENDYICSICHYGGELILCDQCPSSFHKGCLGLQDVPEGDWFCPTCRCGICGQGKFNGNRECFTDDSVLGCEQCEHQYHVGCLRKRGQIQLESYPQGNWFCCNQCEKISMGLHSLLGKPIPVEFNNLNWTLLKYEKHDGPDIDAMTESHSKLSVALNVMHECFEPVKEPLTGRDLVEDVVFSRGSDLNRLNFRGFYTVILERSDEIITVATIRVHGEKVAEVPLVSTRFQYRRLGMCRIVMNVLEKKLKELGVERLVLPAVPSVLNTWTTSFHFSKMTNSERLTFLDYTFLDFQDTIMCQKLLTEVPSAEITLSRGARKNLGNDLNGIGDNVDIDGFSARSEVFQAEDIEESEIVDQKPLAVSVNGGSNGSIGSIGVDPLIAATKSA